MSNETLQQLIDILSQAGGAGWEIGVRGTYTKGIIEGIFSGGVVLCMLGIALYCLKIAIKSTDDDIAYGGLMLAGALAIASAIPLAIFTKSLLAVLAPDYVFLQQLLPY